MTVLNAFDSPRYREVLLTGAASGLVAAGSLWVLSGDVPSVTTGSVLHTAAILAAMVVAHEAIHWIALPRGSENFRKNLTYRGDGDRIGVEIRGDLTAARLLFAVLLPFVVLTVSPLAAIAASLVDADKVISVVVVWNAAASGHDLLIAKQTITAIRSGTRTLKADDDGLHEVE